MVTYHYTESGLDNVYIEGLDVIVDDHGEKVIGIPNVNQLHKAIAYGIIIQKNSISGKEFKFIRTEMGYTQAKLANKVKKDAQTIGRWEREETPIDQNAEFVLRTLAAESLDLQGISYDDLAEWCVPTAKKPDLLVDARDTDNYHIAA